MMDGLSWTRPVAPELLCPAGDWASMRAATANGADAVYFGLESFNARARAENFTRDRLGKVVDFLHDHNMRAYVALNTLIYPDELARAQDMVVAVARSGADAAIVQDLGLAALIRQIAPSLPVHASTQMTVGDMQAAQAAMRLGVRRVILPRELSLEEIAAVAASAEVEVFVHGALCISVSGQCRASQSLWGRSGNRGLCGQACRLPYELWIDGQAGQCPGPYLLSPRDLAAHERVGDLIRAGVSALKIEGRMKGPHYVAAATAMYRRAIDAAVATGQRDARAGSTELADADLERALRQSFSRGFCTGFLDGPPHRRLVDGRSPASQGVPLGRVTGRFGGSIQVELEIGQTCRSGDGVVFLSEDAYAEPVGGRVYSVEPVAGARTPARNRSAVVELAFDNSVDLSCVLAGWRVRRSDEPQLERELERTFARMAVRHPVGLDVEAHIDAVSRLILRVRDTDGHRVEVATEGSLAAARKHPLTRAMLVEQLNRLGGTPFELRDVTLIGPDDAPCDTVAVMAPKSVLNDLRRRAVDGLQAMRRAASVHEIRQADALTAIHQELTESQLASRAAGRASGSHLHVLVRTMDQLVAVVELAGAAPYAIATVYLESSDAGELRRMKEMARSAGLAVGLATPRFLKPFEQNLLEELSADEGDVVLARSLGAVEFFRGRGVTLVGDSSLNIANELSAGVLLAAGVQRFTPACELDRPRLGAMLRRLEGATVEAVIHEHTPMMHTAYCLYAARCGGEGADECGRCGRPCRRHRLELCDRNGECHPVWVDRAGRNTVFRGRCRSMLHDVPGLLDLGVQHFRVELLDESAADTADILRAAAASCRSA